MKFLDIIQKKKENRILTEEEINYFIKNYVNGKIPDYQVSAFLMAIYFNKLNLDETYYLTKGKEIDWDSKMDGNVTWEQGVKSLVLDDICKREWLNDSSAQDDIKLTKQEQSSVKTKALEYFKNSNVKLAKKINISEGRLIKVFEKAEIADKTEKKMEKDGSSTKEMYIKWKKGNNVTAESQWNNINFKEAIFTLEDVK